MLRESILKDILHKKSVALSGIKENQPENQGRKILSEANSISDRVPSNFHCDNLASFLLFFTCSSELQINLPLCVSPSLFTSVSAGCGSNRASTSWL